MSSFRIYLKPFDELGAYVSDWVDITQDVISTKLGNLARQIDANTFDVGVFKFNNFSLSVRNDHGLFGVADSLRSIFNFKRSDTQVRITWSLNFDGPFCGTAICNIATLGEEIDIFQGLLNDLSAQTDTRNQQLTFQVLGLESIFTKVKAPFSAFSDGILFSQVLFACLNQSAITELLGVSVSNINLDNDLAIDDVSSLENKTVKEVLDTILLLSNSVLTIKNQTVIISSRAPSSIVVKEFFGQASNIGIENIISITQIRTGINKTFNFWTWRDTTLLRSDTLSTQQFGVFKKEIDSELLTFDSQRLTVLEALRDEFSFPKQELTLNTPLDYDFFNINFLDKVRIDYPVIATPSDTNDLPIYGSSVYGASVYPDTVFTLVIDPSDEFKILGITINLRSSSYSLQLRRV